MNDKELVIQFFMEGYQNKNYGFILQCLSENYIDHSPAGARSNQEAFENFKVVNGEIVESWGYWPDKEIEALLK